MKKNENYKGFSNSKVENSTKTEFLEGTEREYLIQKIKHLDCPKCLKKKNRLYGFETHQIISVFLFSNYTRSEQILCSSCGIKEKLRTILITSFAGWWSKKGLLSTPKVLAKSLYNLLFLRKKSNKIINRLINEKTGFFRRKGIENTTLTSLIRSRNAEHIPED